jgi:very-short-patch-repair endonuclease
VYNGKGPIVLGGRVPDFVHNNGKHLAINVNGDYFHKNENEHELKSYYTKHGYKLLILWESEINSDWDKVASKIKRWKEDTNANDW